jgi:hypothetical protein
VSSRNERRLERKKIKKQVRNPILRRLLRNELESSRGSEIYRLDDDGTGQPMYFDICAMREWAKGNLEVFAMPPDLDRARRLIESGAVEFDHIRNHTIQTDLTPILVCRHGAGPGQDQIVDGAHRFVALCMGAAMLEQMLPIPIYLLEPDQWRRFVIPRHVAEKVGMQNW